MKKYAALALTLITASLHAYQFRAPLLTDIHGYDFDPHLDTGWQYSFDMNQYSRRSDRAFAKHGTDTTDLSAVFFNKDSFRMSTIFEECQVPRNTEFYNPFMRVITIKPRVKYHEEGMQVSASLARDVFNEKGRWGVRVSVPVKVVTLERTDAGSRRDSQTEDVAQHAINQATGAPTPDDPKMGRAYRLDFLEAMPSSNLSDPQVNYADGNKITILGGATSDGKAGAVYSPEGYAPRRTRVGIEKDDVEVGTQLPVDLSNMNAATIYKFDTDAEYAKLADSYANDAATRVANQSKKATVWVSTSHDGESLVADASQSMRDQMSVLLDTFNSNTYEWLHDRGYVLESSQQMGLGDINVELFYDHTINDRATMAIKALGTLPTAFGSQYNDNNYAGNPYRAHLGNGGHFEVGGGMNLTVEALSWLCWELDANYLFALKSTERRCATPKNSFIKNMGPEQEASVHWSYGAASMQLHFCHPRTTDITGSVGYHLYYKHKDTVAFKNTTIDAWLGRTYNSTDKDFTTAHTTTLDNALAGAQTEQWGHAVRGSLTYHFSDWFAVSGGAAFTVAGQYLPKEAQWHLACRVAC